MNHKLGLTKPERSDAEKTDTVKSLMRLLLVIHRSHGEEAVMNRKFAKLSRHEMSLSEIGRENRKQFELRREIPRECTSFMTYTQIPPELTHVRQAQTTEYRYARDGSVASPRAKFQRAPVIIFADGIVSVNSSEPRRFQRENPEKNWEKSADA